MGNNEPVQAIILKLGKVAQRRAYVLKGFLILTRRGFHKEFVRRQKIESLILIRRKRLKNNISN